MFCAGVIKQSFSFTKYKSQTFILLKTMINWVTRLSLICEIHMCVYSIILEVCVYVCMYGEGDGGGGGHVCMRGLEM